MESLEHAARILFTARALGRVTKLTNDAVARLDTGRARAQREPDA
jgi:hypothetical protein